MKISFANRLIFFSSTFILVGIFCIVATYVEAQEIIDHLRRIDWTNHVGVPGGIPQRTAICATLNPGATASQINSAIANCPANQAVFLNTGTYSISSPITIDRSDVTLKGGGPGKTILNMSGNGLIETVQTGYSEERAIVSGFNKGSTSIVVSNANGIVPGTLLDLYQDDDPDFYWSRSGMPKKTGQQVMVTAVSGTTLQLEDPLVWNFSLNPRFRYPMNTIVKRFGIEDMTLTGGSSFGGDFIHFFTTYASWIKNVETAWGNGNAHIQLSGCLRNEIRDSHIHDTYSTSDGYGILTAAAWDSANQWGHGGCTGTLIENNVFHGLWTAMILETETASAITYNFAFNNRLTSWPNYQVADYVSNHGPHGLMSLYEGNVGVGWQSDGYHGSLSHSTLFRNWFSGQHVEANRTGNIKLVDLGRFTYYHNVVGNVLGFPGWPRTTIGQYEMTGTPGYTEQAVIYRLGYPNPGNNDYNPSNLPSNAEEGGLDPKVKSTLLRHGNYDYQNQATLWDSGISIQTLPISYIYSSKPVWFGAVAWPAIGPDITGGQNADGYVNKIPAQVCYEQGQMPNCLQSGSPPPDTTPPSPPSGLIVQ